MDYYIYSTLSSDNNYGLYVPGPSRGNMPVLSKSVLIKGKANVARGGEFGLVTPLGVRTKITGEEYELIKNNPLFKIHLDNGHIVVQAEIKEKADKVAKDMEKDVSAPKTPEWFEENKEGAMPGDFESTDGKTLKGKKYQRQ